MCFSLCKSGSSPFTRFKTRDMRNRISYPTKHELESDPYNKKSSPKRTTKKERILPCFTTSLLGNGTKMDEALAWVAENQGAAALTWVAVVLATAVLWVVFRGRDEEKAVAFEVLVPEQCRPGWEGKVVEGVLKVCELLFFSVVFFFVLLSRASVFSYGLWRRDGT